MYTHFPSENPYVKIVIPNMTILKLNEIIRMKSDLMGLMSSKDERLSEIAN